jgi:hypothetical protein
MTPSEKLNAASSARWRLPFAFDDCSGLTFNAVLRDGLLLGVSQSARSSVGC